MNIIKILYMDEYVGEYKQVSDKLISMILKNNGKSTTILSLLNSSLNIANNISITVENAPAELKYFLSNKTYIPDISEYTNNISDINNDPLLDYLMSGESIYLYLYLDYQSKINVDFSKMKFSIYYTESKIPLNNLYSLYEFNDADMSSTCVSSYGSGSVTLSNNNMIYGNGFLYFRHDNDIAYMHVDSMSESSYFVSGIFFNYNENTILLHKDDFEFGINNQRKIYININGETLISDISLGSPYDSYMIGLSIKDTDNIICTINNNIANFENAPQSTVDYNISSGNMYICGDGSGNSSVSDIKSIAVYNDYKPIGFHKIVKYHMEIM